LPPTTDAHHTDLRFLLLQIRDADDPMRQQEVDCFTQTLACSPSQITLFDLLSGAPSDEALRAADVVFIGGSGDYSVVSGGKWLNEALETMRRLVDLAVPTFASCWGFQAVARALGGRVVTDLDRAEVGTHTLHLTAAGQTDPLFRQLGPTFLAQQGHQDIVDALPPSAVLLASSDRVECQAFRIADKPIYCTQFHPELDRQALLTRVRQYPQYVERIAGIPFAEFEPQCQETPATGLLLRHFVSHMLASTR